MFELLMIDSWSVRPELLVGQSDLDWNIAKDPSGKVAPNILSELQFLNMDTYGVGINVARLYPIQDNFALYVDAQVSNSKIHNGISQDSDYAANNRQQEFARSYADIDNDKNSQYGFNVGFKTRWLNEKNFLSFLIGREQQDVNITITNGIIAKSDILPIGYRFDDLNTTYNSDFKSWTVGVEAEHGLGWGILSLRYRYHDISFDAQANWNLRDDFQRPVSFIHTGMGYGHEWQLGISYPLLKSLSLNAQLGYRRYQVDNGFDQTFFIVNNVASSYVTRLNQLNYHEKSLQLGLEYLF